MVAIVVVNYKTDELTISYVMTELSKVFVSHKTVVVNNAATEESNARLCSGLGAKLVKDLSEDAQGDVFVLPSPDNLGYAKGNNLGAEFCMKHFCPDFILFSNNDIQFQDDDVVERLVEKMNEIPEAGAIGPKVVGLDGKLQSPYPYKSFWAREVWMYWSSLFYSKEKKASKFQLDYQQNAKEGFHYYVMGSFILVRASDFAACGMFDQNTFLYAEEPILSERMAAIHRKMYYYPEVSVLHAHGVTTSRTAAKKSRDWQFESDLYYYRKYRNVSRPMVCLGRMTHFLMKCSKR